MLRWLGPRKVHDSITGPVDSLNISREVTDDPLAAIEPNRKGQKIYSVSRVNPLFHDILDHPTKHEIQKATSPHTSVEKSNSSGYGGSHGEGSSHEPSYVDRQKFKKDVIAVLEQTNFAKTSSVGRKKSVPSSGSGSSGAGTLSTIPEGKVDISIPKPIWPRFDENVTNYKENSYDSLVDDALLLYTSFNYVPNKEQNSLGDVSLKEILLELSNYITATIDGTSETSSEQTLRSIKEKITLSLNVLRNSTEDEMRKLSVNLSRRGKVNSVIRAFSNSSSSGNSSQSSPEFNLSRQRTPSETTEEIYQIASVSSSSGFSDSVKPFPKRLEDFSLINHSNMRNAIIYGTLCRSNVKSCSVNDKLIDKNVKVFEKIEPKKSLLRASNDSKPSVWQQYYGVNLAKEGDVKQYSTKPTDIPLYPGGRPEADFTLDVPRSEMLSKRMKENKKWRCRCRLLTSFLGLVFFLLSVMAVSLMLTRGKRMFGSMA